MGCRIKPWNEDEQALEAALAKIGTKQAILTAAAGDFFDDMTVRNAAHDNCDFEQTVCRLIDEKCARVARVSKKKFREEYARYTELKNLWGL